MSSIQELITIEFERAEELKQLHDYWNQRVRAWAEPVIDIIWIDRSPVSLEDIKFESNGQASFCLVWEKDGTKQFDWFSVGQLSNLARISREQRFFNLKT